MLNTLKNRKHYVAGTTMLLVAIIGTILLLGSHATTNPNNPNNDIIGVDCGTGWGATIDKALVSSGVIATREDLSNGDSPSIGNGYGQVYNQMTVIAGNTDDNAPLSQIAGNSSALSNWVSSTLTTIEQTPQVTHWEIGNEMYIKGPVAGLQGHPLGDPVSYGKMYLALYKAEQSALGQYPNLKNDILMFSNTGGYLNSSGAWATDYSGQPQNYDGHGAYQSGSVTGGWLHDAAAANPGLSQAIVANAIVTHPYGFVNTDDNYGLNGTGALTEQENVAQSVLGSIPNFYLTEVGFAVGNSAPQVPDQATQAAQLTATYKFYMSDSHVKGVWWFGCHDNPTGNFGILNNDTTPRPALTALTNFLATGTPTPTPNVAITTPINNAAVSGTISLTSNATETGGSVSNVQYMLNGTKLGSLLTVSPYSFSWDTTTVANGTYQIVATATDANGTQANSTPITVTVSNGGGTPGGSGTVQNFKFNSATMTLSWSAYSGAANYSIAQIHNPSTTRNTDYSWPHVSSTSCVDPTGCNLPSPAPGETVNYGIIPNDSSGNNVSGASWSPEISVTWPTTTDKTAPTQPTSLVATAINSSQINLSWTPSTDSGGSGLAGYQIYRSQGSSAPALISTSPTASFGDSGLTPNTTYKYYVVAIDNAKNISSASNTASVATIKTSSTATLEGVVMGIPKLKTGVPSPLSGVSIHTGNNNSSATSNSQGQYILNIIDVSFPRTVYFVSTGYYTQSFYKQYSPNVIYTQNVNMYQR